MSTRAGRTVEILLVEDNPSDLALAERALKHAALARHLLVARDGEEALNLLFGDADGGGVVPRLVLLDLKLPKIDGLEVLRRLKSDPRTKIVPVVVLTSSKEQSDVIESYHLGVNSYVVKPVNFERFAAAVQEVGLYWLLLNHPAHLER